MAPLGLHLAPKPKRRKALGQEVELGLTLDLLALFGRTLQPGKAQQRIARAARNVRRLVGCWLGLLARVVGVVTVDFPACEQLGQPLQFPRLPCAPLACK